MTMLDGTNVISSTCLHAQEEMFRCSLLSCQLGPVRGVCCIKIAWLQLLRHQIFMTSCCHGMQSRDQSPLLLVYLG